MITELIIPSVDTLDSIDELNSRGITGHFIKDLYTDGILVSIENYIYHLIFLISLIILRQNL